MKLTYSAASPFARKVRIAAIELGLIDRIELLPASMSPTQANADYAGKINPLRKLPALILDDGSVVVDSLTIVDYLDDLAGGGKLVPASGPARWLVRSEHSMIQGMLDAMLLCRYETALRPEALRWQAWYDDQWDRAWQGFKLFDARREVFGRPLDITQIALVCALDYADLRFASCGWRDAFPNLKAFHDAMMLRPSVHDTAPPKP
ncbi:glutathione S-transferase family protein [Bradyrhizobium sp. WD16]|uniref:glutathione S-transferase family protein n=1 Tax=Bradyrhizobium sp. WD16 TaxID=1521768 RepID=UPI0020A5975C|nr:glutathione S-transferase family protein [Bradyrhizobium sp. WD16]UTD27624.1 glutathione S-transferase [Bradyrhizobium sp. WD16]